LRNYCPPYSYYKGACSLPPSLDPLLSLTNESSPRVLLLLTTATYTKAISRLSDRASLTSTPSIVSFRVYLEDNLSFLYPANIHSFSFFPGTLFPSKQYTVGGDSDSLRSVVLLLQQHSEPFETRSTQLKHHVCCSRSQGLPF